MIKKVLVVFGTRPEIIKLAPVCKGLLADPQRFQTTICDTGQHGEMAEQLFPLFGIVPTVRLKIMRPDQTLFHISTAVLQAMETTLNDSRPDVVLVQGDTTSAMIASLAAFYFKCKVGHVEAGLRTFNKYSPYPEEMNRRLITQLADYNFAPT